MNNVNSYFLKISGNISLEKQREFKQTIQFIFNQLPVECLSRTLSLDVNTSNQFHFFSLWRSKDALEAFMNGYEFELLKGAYETLGIYHDVATGSWSDVQLFELQHHESYRDDN